MKWKGRRQSKNVYIIRGKDGKHPLKGKGSLLLSKEDIARRKNRRVTSSSKKIKVTSYKRGSSLVRGHSRTYR